MIYVVVGGVLLGNCILHMGHSLYCRYAFYSLMPAGTASGMLLKILIPSDSIPRGPLWTGLEIIALPIPFLATCAQYYLLGLLLDRLVEYWRRRSD